MEDISVFAYVMDLGCGIALPMTLRAMIELDVLNVMAEAGPDARLWPEEIASKIHTSNPNAHEVLDRMLRFLAGHKVVTCEVVVGEEGKSKRRYGLGPVCKFFTKNNQGSMAPMVLKNQHPIFVDAWVNIKHAVLDGSVPFVKTHGMTMFERADKDNIFNEIFNRAMFNQTTILMNKLLENYKGFENINVLVDVGGGHGATLGIILSKYPDIKAINFDLPHVVAQAKPIQGVEFVGGDMFESVPSGGDAIFMKWILHDWSDAHCVKVLKNCWKALPANGKVIVVELVLPESPDDSNGISTGFLADVMMLAYCVGGRERTEKEYRYLAKESGFSGFKTVCNLYLFAAMEFYK